jgi:hypothetical protein
MRVDCRPLPPLHIQEHLAETYFANCHVPYIVLHKPSFMKQLSDGTAAPALVLAVCAVSARYVLISTSSSNIVDSHDTPKSANIPWLKQAMSTQRNPANSSPSNSTVQPSQTSKLSSSSVSMNSAHPEGQEHGCTPASPSEWPSASASTSKMNRNYRCKVGRNAKSVGVSFGQLSSWIGFRRLHRRRLRIF